MATVLLCDDTDTVRDVMRLTLEREGHDVRVASLPTEALAIARAADRIDVLVTDLVMPEMDAFELAGMLAKIHRDLRVLYVSGYADASSEGAFLAKPFTPTQLADAVAGLAA
jgi:two-component system cell cycle sensor histidine kinase/response regulator CckA